MVGVFAKAEWYNPGGSVKARAALRMVEEAERSGELQGKTIIDSSSGNTGIALALIGAVKGYAVHLVMPANVSIERKALVKAYGAHLIESDPLEGSDGAIEWCARSWKPTLSATFTATNTTTRPTGWRISRAQGRRSGSRRVAKDAFCRGLGTTGTFTGTGRYLRQRNPAVELVAVQPEDELSVIEGLKHLETAIVPGIMMQGCPTAP